MGAWSSMEPNLEWVLQHLELAVKRPVYAGRPASAAMPPASAAAHARARELLHQALAG